MNFRTRRPWLAAVLGYFSTFIAMLYVGRGRRAFAYLGATLILVAAAGYGAVYGWRWSVAAFYVVLYVITLVGMVDAYRIARHHRQAFHGPWYSRWYILVGVYVGVVLVVFGQRAFLFEPYRFPSASMMPTFHTGDFFLAYKWPYGHYGAWGVALTDGARIDDRNRPRRGDLVVFRFPGERSVTYMKRIVGLPGDRLAYREQRLYLNGVEVERKFLHETTYRDPGGRAFSASVYEERLDDSVHLIQHTGAANHPPLEFTVPDGHYFVMGDNRDRSNDSRYCGPLPAADIVGRPVYIWMSFDAEAGAVRTDRIGAGFR